MNNGCKRLCIFTVCMVVVSAAIYYNLYHPGAFNYDGFSKQQQQLYDYPYSFPVQGGGGGVAASSQTQPPPVGSEPTNHTIVHVNDRPALVLYSARYDSTLDSVVLIGYYLNRIGPPPRVTCRLGDVGELPWQPAGSHAMHEGHSKPYDGVMYFCPAKGWTPRHLARVRVNVEYPKASGSVVLPVQVVAMATAGGGGAPANTNTAAACVTALRFVPGLETESRFILRLVEFIEVNRLLGVGHFFFYNWSLPADTSRTLRHYIGLGWVSVNQWSLPAGIRPEEDIHYFGQMPVTNDCLYLARDQYRLVAFIDIDEFLVPLGGAEGTLTEAARMHGLEDRGGTCALGFRHGLFPLMGDSQLGNDSWARLPRGLAGCHVTSLLYYRRAKDVMPFTQRSKLLVVARQIKEMGIHFAWDTWLGCSTKQLNPATEGLLHHLRSWSPVELVEDTSVSRFAKGIADAMIGARQRLKQLLGLDICR